MKFTVLMSIYDKEKSIFLDAALKSVLVDQTRIPDELVLVKDGNINDELEKVIKKYKDKFTHIIKVVGYHYNKGLGEALKYGVNFCSHELIARMDSDDISKKYRFEKQLKFMKENPEISVVGSNISEFYENPNNLISNRTTPEKHIQIKEMLKRRSPMNHVSVMIRKASLIKAGGYLHLPFIEDYYLWARLIHGGHKLHNIQEVLVLVRTGDNMYKRRGNLELFKSWGKLQKEMLNMKLINKIQYFINNIKMIIFRFTPTKLKEIIYLKFLRKKIK